MKGSMCRPMCIRETVWFSHSSFTEYLNIKTSASIPHVHFSGGSEVRLLETTLLGVSQVLLRDEVSARLGSHILLLVHPEHTLTGMLQPRPNAFWKLSCYKSYIYAIKAINVIDLWPQRRKICHIHLIFWYIRISVEHTGGVQNCASFHHQFDLDRDTGGLRAAALNFGTVSKKEFLIEIPPFNP